MPTKDKALFSSIAKFIVLGFLIFIGGAFLLGLLYGLVVMPLMR